MALLVPSVWDTDSLKQREVRYNIVSDLCITMKLFRPIKMCLNKTYNKVRIDKRPCETFLIQIDMKQGGTSSPLVVSVVLEYAAGKIRENQEGLKLKGRNHLLVFVNGVINVLKENTDVFWTLVKKLVEK